MKARNCLLLLWLSVIPVFSVADDLRLSITGSSTIAPLVQEMAKRYEKQNPNVRIDVQTGGSTRGLVDVRRATADIGMVSRALTPAESDVKGHLLALDGVALIIHSSNPVKTLSQQQIIDIYTGKISRWQPLGGPDKAITVVHKAEGRSTQEVFLGYFKLKNSQVRPSAIIGDNQQGIKTVAGNPAAIGYVSIGAAAYEVERGTPIKLLPLVGVEPTVANVRNGTFPLSRQLNLVTADASPPAKVKAFIEFVQSDAVNDLIEGQFFVPAGH